ncbi:hypothetical protein [Succinivibrio sp.]|uniref:hypothetical protein n=1 Tax=Succinivibrio sp. TaxID=2053619 RepID=UPI0025837F3D|nr:hypothetical protein [Succinivibrio sp.]MCI6938374.1 hypothetical protein [Succinatimonas hippei]MDD6205524.1 hypothetical protein [Succinivibrio sp.]
MALVKKSLLALTVAATLSGSANAAFFLTPSYTGSSADELSYSKVGVTLGNEYVYGGFSFRDYDIDHAKDIEAKDIFFGGEYRAQLDSKLGYFVGGSLDFSYDEEFDFTESYNVNAFGGLTYDLGSGLSVVGGLGTYLTDPKNYFYPVLMAKYKNANDLGFSFIAGFPTTSATYRFSNMFAVVADVKFASAEPMVYMENYYRNYDVYMLDKSREVSVAALFSPADRLSLKAGVGYTFDRKLKYYNADGDEIARYDVDDDLKVFVSGSFTF